MRAINKHLTVAVIILSIIILLVTIGPVRAALVGLTISNNFPVFGEFVNLIVSAEIEPDEILDTKNFTLSFEGPQNIVCDFLPDGTFLNPCPGIQIQQIETADYQFGYGFLPGILKYNITLDSGSLQAGEYMVKLFVITPQEKLTAQEQMFIIGESTPVEKCSLRAEDGSIIFDGKTFNSPRTKLNLGVSESRARKGQGFITAQQGRERISYEFDIDNAIRVSSRLILIYTSGTLKQPSKENKPESAVISFDTDSFKLDIDGDSLEIEDMKIYFAKC